MADAAVVVVTGPIGTLRIGLVGGIWRLAPTWAVAAGAITNGFLPLVPNAWLSLVGAVVLAELAWGAMWALPLTAGEGHAGGHRWPLPYLQPGCPADRIWRAMPAHLWPGVVLGGLIALAVSALLGPPALLLSVFVMLLSAWTVWAARSGVEPALGRAVLAIGLPWALGATVGSHTRPDATTSSQGIDSLLGLVSAADTFAVAVAFVTLEWGLGRLARVPASRGRLVWLGLATLIAVLLALHLQLAVLVIASLALPAILAVLRSQDAIGALTGRSRSVGFAGPWWWAMLVVAVCALRWRVF